MLVCFRDNLKGGEAKTTELNEWFFVVRNSFELRHTE